MSSSFSFMESESRHQAYSRKDKSLGLLCANFVGLYNRDGVESIGLDDASRRLGVERRRIYDIVNVLESIGMLVRKAKNQYSWIGFPGIPKALDELKAEALKELSCGSMAGSCSKKAVDDDEDDKSVDQDEDVGEEKLSQTSNASSVNAPLKAKSVTDNRKEKSLSLLTQNFVKLLLTTSAETVSLDEAAKLLLGDGPDSTVMRNNNAAKVRRLYDIANVLSSMNLIEKTQQADTRKPAFRWVGTKGKENKCVTVAIPPPAKLSTKRMFATDFTNVDHKRTKMCSLVDRKFGEAQIVTTVSAESSATAEKQPKGSKGYVYGPFCPVGVTKSDSDSEEKPEKVADWETLASFRPQYHNQALSELFAHYMEAWKSWHVKSDQRKSSQQLHHSAVNQFS